MAKVSRMIFNEEEFNKVCVYLRNCAELMKNHNAKLNDNIFCKSLEIKGGVDDGLHLDAMIEINKNKINLLKIWVMDYDVTKHMYFTKNKEGETGQYANILGEKYFNCLLEYARNYNEANDDGRRDITLTPDNIKKIESEIDFTVISLPMDEQAAKHYERFEIIEFAKYGLRDFLIQCDVTLSDIKYNDSTSEFLITIYPENESISIPLLDVVNKKYKENESFVKALVMLVGDWLAECVC